MDASALQPYIVPALVAAWLGWRFLKFRAVKARLPELLRRGAVVVDVRGPEEYAAGARPGSLNIPLGALADRAKELDASKPVIVCCASGTRSAMAAGILKSRGFRVVVNAGPWTNTL
ncbi:MAG: rhodanese-like domain-containing protein [Elusimicrobiota bacterium]|nr:rhodanese-like domain-containing protein [Elusimicrobiota bacterium]